MSDGVVVGVGLLAVLVWPWYRALLADTRKDWRGEGNTRGER